MGMSSLKVLKYVVFFFNLLFWVCGCTILGFGIYFLIKNSFGALFYSLPSLTVGNVVIIVGTIIMVVAFLGCMGSIKENKCLLMSFFVLLLFILLIEVTMAILLFVYEQKIDDYVAGDLSQSIQRYRSDNSTRMAWDGIQEFLECCGVNGTSDWNGHPPESCPSDPKTQKSQEIDQSSPPRPLDPLHNQLSVKGNPSLTCAFLKIPVCNYEGCYMKAKVWFHSNFLYIGILIISVCVIQVLGMSFALTLNCQIEKNSQSLGI